MDIKAMFFDESVIIITENVHGEIYMIKSNTYDILQDWNGDCNFVPSNDARVFFASWYGKPVSPYEYTNFESLIHHLEYLQIYG